ncbi:MAG: hypothetical protein D3905_09480, partial [Candidatus Electrothrix sp. AS4_5]|nr:hypothetical protein [Candidatus Electrothrix gigas]
KKLVSHIEGDENFFIINSMNDFPTEDQAYHIFIVGNFAISIELGFYLNKDDFKFVFKIDGTKRYIMDEVDIIKRIIKKQFVLFKEEKKDIGMTCFEKIFIGCSLKKFESIGIDKDGTAWLRHNSHLGLLIRHSLLHRPSCFRCIGICFAGNKQIYIKPFAIW